MRILVALILSFAWLAAAPPAQEQKKQAAKPVPQSPRPADVPAEAKEFEPGAWRYIDSQGKTWLYRRTPFGIMKGEERIVSDDLPPGMVAFDDGDNIRFEKPSPFGHLKWAKKKTDELNDVEQRVWERDRTKALKPAAASEAAKPEKAKSAEQQKTKE